MKTQVFVSYAREDQEIALRIVEALEKEGISCWVDKKGIRFAQAYTEAIDQAIRASSLVIWVASQHSLASHYVHHEISAAQTQKKARGLVYLESMDPTQLPPPFNVTMAGIQGAEFFRGSFEDNVAKLAADIKEVLRGLLGLRFPPRAWESAEDGRELPDVHGDDTLPTPGTASSQEGRGLPDVRDAPIPPRRTEGRGMPNWDGDDTLALPGEKPSGKRGRGTDIAMAMMPGIPAMPGNPDTPGGVVDCVHFSVTSPSLMARGQEHTIDVWAYFANQRERVIAMAREESAHGKIRVKSKGPAQVVRGTVLMVRLQISGLKVEPREDTILWIGEIGNASFSVSVPPDAPLGQRSGVATIHIGAFRVARVVFEVVIERTVSGGARRAKTQHGVVERHRKAFASYADADRDDVLGRIHGLQKGAPNLDIFFAPADIASGENWKHRLEQEIKTRDVMYLFWSRAASQSKYVEWEWRLGLQEHGVDFIDPVPLVLPDEVPPPPELAEHLHFNDWVLAYMRGAGRAAADG